MMPKKSKAITLIDAELLDLATERNQLELARVRLMRLKEQLETAATKRGIKKAGTKAAPSTLAKKAPLPI